jgi:hypothetical protein
LHKNEGGWSAPTSPTSGMAAYSLEGQRTQRASRRKRLALLLERITRKAPSGNSHMRKASEMTTEVTQFDVMLDTLKKSAIQIAKSDSDKRDELLAKSIDEFANAWTQATEEVVEDVAGAAFEDGAQTGLFGLAKGEDQIVDAMTVLGALVAQVDEIVGAANEILGKAEAFSALKDWSEAGKTIVTSLGRQIDAQLAKGEVSEEEIAKAEGEIKDELKKAQAKLEKRIAALAKEEGMEMEEEGGEVDPIEVIGRLAAAILVQIDQLQGGDEEAAAEEAPMDEEDEYGKGEKAKDLKKDEVAPVTEEKVEKAETAETTEVAAVAEEKVEKAAAPAMSDEAEKLLKAALDRINALEKSQGDLAKENESLKKANVPAPKGVLRAVDKAEDTLGKEADVKALAERLEKMSPDQRAFEMIKIAQQRPERAF